jgi:hypothetical protein
MCPPVALFDKEPHRVQLRQVDVTANGRYLMRDRVVSGGGGRDRPFGGFDGALRPARSDQSPDVSYLRRGPRQPGSRCLHGEKLSTRPSG